MVVAMITGMALGTVFFGGLWFAVKKAMISKSPGLWFFGSLILRMGIVLAGFYLIIQGGSWLNALIFLLGFVIARLFVIRLTSIHELTTRLKQERKQASYES